MKNLFFGLGLTNPKPNVLKTLHNNNYLFLKKYKPLPKQTQNLHLNRIDFKGVLRLALLLIYRLGGVYLTIRTPHNFILNSDMFCKLNTKMLVKLYGTKKFSLKNYKSVLKKKYFYIYKRFEYVWEKYYFRSTKTIYFNTDENLKEHSSFFSTQLIKLKLLNAWEYLKKFKDRLRYKPRKFLDLHFVDFKFNLNLISFVGKQHVYAICTEPLKYLCMYIKPPLRTIYNTLTALSNCSTQVAAYTWEMRSGVFFWYREAKFSRQRKLYYAYYLHKTFKRPYNNYWASNFYKAALEKYTSFKITAPAGINYSFLNKSNPKSNNFCFRDYELRTNFDKAIWNQPQDTKPFFTLITPQNHVNLVLFFKKDILSILGPFLLSCYHPLNYKTTDINGFNKTDNYGFLIKDGFIYAQLNEGLNWGFRINPKYLRYGINLLDKTEVLWGLSFKNLIMALTPGLYISEAEAYKTINVRELIEECFALHRWPKSLVDFVAPETDLFFKTFEENGTPSLNIDPKKIKFRKPSLRKRNFKKTVLIPSRRLRKVRRRIFGSLFAHPLDNDTSFFTKFFFNLEKYFLTKNNFLQNTLLNANFDKFEIIDNIQTHFFNFSEDTTLTLYSKSFIKGFNSSNYNPISLLSHTFRKNLYKKRHFDENTLNNRYLQFYVNGFIARWTSLKSFFILQSNHNFINNDFTNNLISLSLESMFYFNKVHVKFFRRFPVSKFVEFFTFSMFKKDLNYFVKYLKHFVEDTPLKDHKKVFSSFEFMLKKFLYKILTWTKTKGIKFEVAGKISVTGNSKKRRKIVKLGYYSLTHKKLKIDYLLDTIRTSTGVLGFRMFMTY